jgi:Ni/Co efflux regulator RcnB
LEITMNRLAKTLVTVTTVAALAVPAAAQAKHGADDPAGHVRHASHHVSKARSASTHHSRHHHGRHHARRADDAAGHVRHSGGADDGPNHS